MVNYIYNKLKNMQLRMNDIRALAMLDIVSCRIDDEGDCEIVLGGGETFISFTSSPREEAVHRKFSRRIPATVPGTCFRTVLDIVQRYVRENSLPPIPGKSHFLYPGWGFVDLGSYIGYGAMKAARKVGHQGHVVAVEASPDAYRILCKNIEKNQLSNITPVHAAVQNQNGELDFYFTSSQNNSIHQQLDDKLGRQKQDFKRSVTVPAKSIDAIIAETGYPYREIPTHMSFEINGAEARAIDGMHEFIKGSPRFVLRIAARYNSGKDDKDPKKELVGKLSEFPGLRIADLAPYLFVFK